MPGFKFVAPGCSWYEHHMLGGCRRAAPQPACLPHRRRNDNQRLAVIIPFRGAATPESFRPLCEHLPAHLAQHSIRFHLLAVNQVDQHPFNRAALINAGVAVLSAGGRRAGLRTADQRPFSCFAMHDVDRFPVPSSANSSCEPFTAQYYTCPAMAPLTLHSSSFTGGVLLLRPELFRAVNGFSNAFWGWGHEDNEFYLRLRACGLRPEQPPEIEWCMDHQDCAQCKRAKPGSGPGALRAETRNIALVQGRLSHPESFMAADGLSTVNFTTAARTTQITCGGHTLHVLDVQLHRRHSSNAQSDTLPCVADGSQRDDGCIAPMAPEHLPKALLARAEQGLPPGAHILRVVRATRERVMYNFHYEVLMQTTGGDGQGGRFYRVALCAQEWQPVDTPDSVRYQLLWRAIEGAESSMSGAKPHRPRKSKEFGWSGHFPCTLRPPPWKRAV